jgi:hypothetical protein
MAAKQLNRTRAEFLSRAGQAFDRMFGADGQNGLVKFTRREDRACDSRRKWLAMEKA